MRGDKPFLFTNVRGKDGIANVIKWIKSDVLFEDVNKELHNDNFT